MYWYVGRWLERYTCVLVRGQMIGTLHLFIGMWTDGRNGAPVVFWFFWLDLATMGMRLLSACAVKGTVGVPCSLQRNLLSVVVGSSRHDSVFFFPVRHVQASTEACQTIECILSFQICVILCRRLGSRNDVVIRHFSLNHLFL